MLLDLVYANRTCRRFEASRPVNEGTLRHLVDLARVTASAGNLQPLRYVACHTPGANEKVFERLAWAGYLPDWPGPPPQERPAAYIVMAVDTRITKKADFDAGIAAQTILLGAREKGLAGAIIAAVNRPGLAKDLSLDEHLMVVLFIALGKPVEAVVLEDMGPEGDVRYHRDAGGVHYVPKRALDDILTFA